ncbi:MAG: hypothetical protein NC238_15045 [Dehalobacter sp.]|nr:hypothetical protein [Dehalobacter sp.]
MKYLKVEWIHNFLDEPIEFYSEIDDERYEVRKIIKYRDGRIGYATPDVEVGGAILGELPMPESDQIASDSQFKPIEITQEDFEILWNEKIENK